MRNRLLLPAALVAFVVALGLLSFAGSPTPARAQPTTVPTTAAGGASPSSTAVASPSTTSSTLPVP
jgi:hypothetical protein